MPKQQFKLLYDGDCPFCRREVEWLKRRDHNDRLAIENIAALGFDPAKYGLSREEVMGSLHGIFPDGRVVRRVEALAPYLGLCSKTVPDAFFPLTQGWKKSSWRRVAAFVA
jgi:predicted DCC family thiol-disulfide oxidoreductase YuxK